MCFTLGWLEGMLVYLVAVVAVIMILKLLIPWIIGQLGIPLLGQVLSIVLWAIITILVIYAVFALLSCLFAGGMPLLPHSRY